MFDNEISWRNITLEEQDNVDFNLISKPPVRNFYFQEDNCKSLLKKRLKQTLLSTVHVKMLVEPNENNHYSQSNK